MSQFESLDKRPSARIRPQEVLRLRIAESILDEETALFDVLPGLGKSRSAALAAKADIPISVFTNLTDNYDQFENWSQEDGVDFEKFPRTTEDCPTIRGDHSGDNKAKAAEEMKRQGWPVATIHKELDLPCQRDGPCEYMEKVRSLDTEGPGILVGNHVQAYVESYVENRVVVLDEDAFDEFYEVIRNPAAKAQEFIDTLDDFPFSEIRRLSGTEREKALSQLEEVGLEPEDHTDSAGEFHAKAPLITYAIYGAESLDNGLKHIELPGNRTAIFDKLYPTNGGTHDDGTPTIWLLDPPDLSKAEAVIGLDATPCIPKWERILGDDFEHYRFYDDEGRNRYLRAQGYEFIQLHPHAWPAQGGQPSIPKCEAYLREVYQEHGEPPDLITSKAILGEKDDKEGLKDRGLDHLWNRDLYFGDFRGKNLLQDSELLVVLGSPSRSDNHISHLTALFGESAEREQGTQGPTLSYGNSTADEILDTIRQGGVFQAAMRAGREDDAEATVYIATGLVPGWLETKQVGQRLPSGVFDACPNPREKSDRAVIEVLREEDGISGHEISRRAEVPKSTVSDALNRLRQEGLVEKVGRGRGTKWHSRGIEDANIAGKVDLERIADIPKKNSIRPSRPFSGPDFQRQQLLDNPSERYPDWAREILQRLQERKEHEQMKQRRRTQR